jgi:hypothetical protein
MGALRRFGQSLGLVFRDEHARWRVGWTPPTASTSQPGHTPLANLDAADRPWWNVTRPASQAGLILFGIVFASLGVGNLVVYALGGLTQYQYLISSFCFLVLSSMYLTSAAARYRRER